VVGALIAVLGIAVLVIAVFALRHPHNKATAAGTATTTQTVPAPSSTLNSGETSGGSAGGTSTPPSSSSSGSSGSPVPLPLKKAITLIVLNNTSHTGLAQQASLSFEHGGWQVTSFADNYHNDIASTAAYYDPSIARAHAAALALQKQFPAIKRVVPKFTGLPAGPVVVVLDPDYTAG
jgi:hypothetical protein